MTQECVVTQFMVLLLHLLERRVKNHETPRSVRSITSYANLPCRISSPSCSIQHLLNYINVKMITYYYFYCDTSVGIVTGLWTRRPQNRGSIPGCGKTFVSSPQSPHRLQGPSSLQRTPTALSLRLKGPRHKADHSPPSTAEVKNPGSYTSTLPNAFITWAGTIPPFYFITITILYRAFRNVLRDYKHL